MTVSEWNLARSKLAIKSAVAREPAADVVRKRCDHERPPVRVTVRLIKSPVFAFCCVQALRTCLEAFDIRSRDVPIVERAGDQNPGDLHVGKCPQVVDSSDAASRDELSCGYAVFE